MGGGGLPSGDWSGGVGMPVMIRASMNHDAYFIFEIKKSFLAPKKMFLPVIFGRLKKYLRFGGKIAFVPENKVINRIFFHVL